MRRAFSWRFAFVLVISFIHIQILCSCRAATAHVTFIVFVGQLDFAEFTVCLALSLFRARRKKEDKKKNATKTKDANVFTWRYFS